MQIFLDNKCYDSLCPSSLRDLYLYLVSLLDEAIMNSNKSKMEEIFEKMNNAELFVFYDSFLDKLDLTTKELFRKHSLLSLHSISVSNSLRNIILQIAFSFWYLYLAKITKSKLGFLHTTLLEFVPYTMNVKQYPNDINELKEFANIDKYF